jgi:hypothetical protein
MVMDLKKRTEVKTRMEKHMRGIPEHMHKAIYAYVLDGQPSLGNFLKAVFRNNLVDAVLLGDLDNQRAMCQYGMLLWHGAPRDCWGSEKAIADWIDGKGLEFATTDGD